MGEKTFLLDPNLCLGCRACQMACAANRGLAPGVFLRRVKEVELRRKGQWVKYFLSSACHQCQNPECVRLCPEKALRKRKDGIVILDAGKCSGCGVCLQGCPFEAPVRDPETGRVLKCDFCYERVDEGLVPFCVEACPVNALRLIELSDEREENPEWVRRLPGVENVQLTHPSIRYYPLREGRQVRRHWEARKAGTKRGEE
ncbi:4Fe-4S ferredoxin-type, iron-sulphur binding domain protein [Acididesulfobacillus acetoxydans]|uniref:4Fe-4S ferredoxin-type, iron-sulphur binding domain protein n=1 Tax=Acididesulfobacillus acetoxydans TaxID=1561005 RepID=A0A8S0WQF6_9FIRM|nr:4Fe-4S dicluster domain-containing protein [Acididesulfobacillus acetoxydans]CAA7602594.1 4Fe-4S ferredoxin-type, iron-sulphur binding domain protein [Acididesulfobacillus acetoxydans]CEJ07259.1 Anaerobic dimethyl sulfoxide reductase chain B [Acididesulfobacillus acetoxydans]